MHEILLKEENGDEVQKMTATIIGDCLSSTIFLPGWEDTLNDGHNAHKYLEVLDLEMPSCDLAVWHPIDGLRDLSCPKGVT